MARSRMIGGEWGVSRAIGGKRSTSAISCN
jgi:hypothetical protein